MRRLQARLVHDERRAAVQVAHDDGASCVGAGPQRKEWPDSGVGARTSERKGGGAAAVTRTVRVVAGVFRCACLVRDAE